MSPSTNLESDIIYEEMNTAVHREHGLTVLPFRTGSGKSYNLEKLLARYIYDIHQNPALVADKYNGMKQFVVLIPNKINFLCLDHIAQRIVEISHEKGNANLNDEQALSLAKENILFMPTNLDCLIAGLSRNGEIDNHWIDFLCHLPFENKGVQESFKKSIDQIAIYGKARQDVNGKKYADALKEPAACGECEIRKILRKTIKYYKKQSLNSSLPQDKRHFAEEQYDKFVKLTKQLFSIARYDEYKVIITTVDKMIRPIDPVISPKISIIDPSFIQHRLFIFDESDSAYGQMKEKIIQDNSKRQYPLVETIRRLNTYLNKTPSAKVKNAGDKAFPPGKSVCCLSSLRKQCKEIIQKYSLVFPYKTEDGVSNMPALLNDGISFSLSEGDRYIHCYRSETRQQVMLCPGKGPRDKKLKEDEIRVELLGLFHDANQILRRFIIYLRHTASVYVSMPSGKIDSSSDPDDRTFLNGVKSILHMMGMPNEEVNLYSDLVQVQSSIPKSTDLFDADISFYCRGYSFVLMQDNEINQAENTIIQIFSMRQSPESILLHLAQETNVICLSATALNRSINENFDMEYLFSKLLDDFHEISESTRQKLKDFYMHKEEPYTDGRCHISVISLPVNQDFSKDVNGHIVPASSFKFPIFHCKSYRDLILQQVHSSVIHYIRNSHEQSSYLFSKKGKDNMIYLENRYLNLIRAIYEFLADPFKESMVVFEKKKLDSSTSIDSPSAFSESLIRLSIQEICMDLQIPYEEDLLITAESSNFLQRFQAAKNRWEQGKKAIFITTYQTTSKGSNLQYAIPEIRRKQNQLVVLLPELAQIPGMEAKYEHKDIDCLYLGTYTFLVNQLHGSTDQEQSNSFHRSVWEYEKLFEKCQIDHSAKLRGIQQIYNRFRGANDRSYTKLLQDTEGIRNTVNKMLKQSIGRMDRTHVKPKETVIYINQENLAHLDQLELADTEDELTPAMREIYHAVVQTKNPDSMDLWDHSNIDRKQIKMRSEQKHRQSVACFHRLFTLCRSANADTRRMAIEEYSSLREFVLRHPVLTESAYQSLSQHDKKLVERYYIDSVVGHVNSYSFDVRNKSDGKDLDQCFIAMGDFVSAKATRSVSESSTILGKVMQIPNIHDFFVTNGYCTSWPQGRFLLTPKGFDLYSGILGETIARFILSDMITALRSLFPTSHIPVLEELDPSVFEFFDFRFGSLYIDVKNWMWGTRQVARDFKVHNLEKRDVCDEFYHQKGTVLILNLWPEKPHMSNESLVHENRYYELRRLFDEDGTIDPLAKAFLFQLLTEAVPHES